MLKIKDNVDLRKLRKYKFDLNYIWLMSDRTIHYEHKDDYYIQQNQMDILYDLTKAGLVEKVGDNDVH